MNSSGNNMTRKLSKDNIEWHSRDKGSYSQREGSIGSYGGRERGGSNTGSVDNGYGLNVSGYDNKNLTYSDGASPYAFDTWNKPFIQASTDESPGGIDMLTKRDRSRSKDFDNLISVNKLIRSVNKKMLSIQELEFKLYDDKTLSVKELNDEQKDKLSRKESLQSEMKRLKLILARLEGEDRVRNLAKASREKILFGKRLYECMYIHIYTYTYICINTYV
jgi:hypothetical protein